MCIFRNVIDVAALDSHNLQQHEYLERTKMYNSKVQQILSANRNKLNKKLKCILEDIMNPDEVLNSEPIKKEDLIMVNVFYFLFCPKSCILKLYFNCSKDYIKFIFSI